MKRLNCIHDDVIKWKHFPRYWPLVREIHRWRRGLWRRALMFSLLCTWINGWVNNRAAGDLRRHRAHYDAIVMNIGPEALASWKSVHLLETLFHLYIMEYVLLLLLLFAKICWPPDPHCFWDWFENRINGSPVNLIWLGFLIYSVLTEVTQTFLCHVMQGIRKCFECSSLTFIIILPYCAIPKVKNKYRPTPRHYRKSDHCP